tara:strand:+ start:83 stop:835 length:753 start_codon:yes stop_codon:yes gene_type:complete
MKNIRFLFALAIITIVSMFTPPAKSATWNDSVGMGNPSDDWLFNGAGVLHGTVGSVRTNFLYYVTSAKSSGAPKFSHVNFWTDSTRPSLEVWTATNTWTIASNAVAGTTNIWLTGTNLSMTTNDVLVLRDVANDCYQQVLVGPFPLGGLLLTNALGQNQISLWSVPTNAVTAGDILYKMARTQVINPVIWYQNDNGTNGLSFTKTNYYSIMPGTTISGRLGIPTMVGVWATNPAACWLNVSGEYYARPRR